MQGKEVRRINNLYCCTQKIIVALMVVLLSACASSPKEVVIRDVGGSSSIAAIHHEEIDGQAKKQSVIEEVSRESTPVAIQPVYSTSARLQSPLQKKLLESAQEKLSNNDPQGAIVLAEKGLRIDRKDPQFYIILADAYARIDNKKQSSYFAQQGLRYAQKDSREYRALQRWLH